MKNKFKGLVIPIIVLTLIASVMAALLGGTNLLTADRIAELTAANEKAAVTKVIDADNVSAAQKVVLNEKAYDYYVAKKGNKLVGYAFVVSANGYGGTVKTVVGMDITGKVTAIEVTDVANETPGLGQNAKKKDFTDRFIGVEDDVAIVKSGGGQGEIKAITGATITSKAVAKSVNIARQLFTLAVKEGN